jgi:hypothetical protein
MKGAARDQLIDDVMHGRLTPAEAEAEAVRLNIPPSPKILTPRSSIQ